MSSKYVPPSLRNVNTSSHTNSTMHANVSSGTTTRPLSMSSSDSVKTSMVNTSLPAKEAPKLVPGTLASLTSSTDTSSMQTGFQQMTLEKVSIFKGTTTTKKPALTDEEFPTLGGKPRAAAKPVMNFAEKAREWAAKQKEDERIAAEEAEKERIRINVERMMKEKEEEEEKRYKKTIVTIASKKKSDEFLLDEDKTRRYVEEEEEEPYESPVDEEEYEEEEQEEYNSHWDGRRYRDE